MFSCKISHRDIIYNIVTRIIILYCMVLNLLRVNLKSPHYRKNNFCDCVDTAICSYKFEVIFTTYTGIESLYCTTKTTITFMLIISIKMALSKESQNKWSQLLWSYLLHICTSAVTSNSMRPESRKSRILRIGRKETWSRKHETKIWAVSTTDEYLRRERCKEKMESSM